MNKLKEKKTRIGQRMAKVDVDLCPKCRTDKWWVIPTNINDIGSGYRPEIKCLSCGYIEKI